MYSHKLHRALAALAVLAILMSLAGCGKTPAPTPDEPKPTTPTVTLQDTLSAVQPATHYDWADGLPKMDGSTSTIPLEAGIRAALFGTSIAEAELAVHHSTTHQSFANLIEKNCDLIFSVPISPEQQKKADDAGVTLEMQKIAAEGFVFVVNAKNPVDSLTQQQLRDIYSGKITNWSEVGGNDAPIVAYQRNEDSGSQNYMHAFMGDTPLMDKLMSAQTTPSSMGELMDAVALYDNAEAAIGYSVYAYAADMYGNGNEIKFIHVDGVEPTKATMADGSYPLLSYNYAIWRADTPSDSPLRKLTAWLTTDEGQRAIKSAGYVPLRPVGDVPETAVALYTATGTGKQKPTEPLPLDRYTIFLNPDTHDTYKLDDLLAAMKNQELRAKIEAFIEKNSAEMKKDLSVTDKGIRTSFECVNGYLAVMVIAQNDREEYRAKAQCASVLYDLATGKEIPFSALFYKDVPFATELNRQINEQILASHGGVDENVEYGVRLKRPFAGIPAGHDTFMLTSVVFAGDNLYFADLDRQIFDLKGLGDLSVLREPDDMRAYFDDSLTIFHDFWEEDGYSVKKPLLWNNDYYAELMDETHYDPAVCEKVNTAIRQFCRDRLTCAAMKDWSYRAFGRGDVELEGGQLNLYELGGRYLRVSGGMLLASGAPYTPYEVSLYFDKATGEEISYTTFLKDGWQEAATWFGKEPWRDEEPEPLDTLPSLDGATLGWSHFPTNGNFRLFFEFDRLDTPVCYCDIPLDYVRFDV